MSEPVKRYSIDQFGQHWERRNEGYKGPLWRSKITPSFNAHCTSAEGIGRRQQAINITASLKDYTVSEYMWRESSVTASDFIVEHIQNNNLFLSSQTIKRSPIIDFLLYECQRRIDHTIMVMGKELLMLCGVKKRYGFFIVNNNLYSGRINDVDLLSGPHDMVLDLNDSNSTDNIGPMILRCHQQWFRWQRESMCKI
jgi:hypothetical protein